jgi:hypothetical protein
MVPPWASTIFLQMANHKLVGNSLAVANDDLHNFFKFSKRIASSLS